jgi:hypothetical protein
MAAGLGFKTFTTGEVLTADNVNGYLMQGILVFASAAARDAAITSPQEGQACYLKDTNQVLTYSGSAWVAVGGGSPLTTKGDVYGFSTVDARIPIGANDTVLTADSTQALGLKWATPAAGGMTLISETVASANTAIDFTSISGSYKQLLLVWAGIAHNAADGGYGLRLNANSGSVYVDEGTIVSNTTVSSNFQTSTYLGDDSFGFRASGGNKHNSVTGWLIIDNYSSTTKEKTYRNFYAYKDDFSGAEKTFSYVGRFASTTAITQINILRRSGTATISNQTNTSIRLYGLS